MRDHGKWERQYFVRKNTGSHVNAQNWTFRMKTDNNSYSMKSRNNCKTYTVTNRALFFEAEWRDIPCCCWTRRSIKKIFDRTHLSVIFSVWSTLNWRKDFLNLNSLLPSDRTQKSSKLPGAPRMLARIICRNAGEKIAAKLYTIGYTEVQENTCKNNQTILSHHLDVID